MILFINVGPEWEGPEPLTFRVSNLLQMIPILIGWLASEKATAVAVEHADPVTS